MNPFDYRVKNIDQSIERSMIMIDSAQEKEPLDRLLSLVAVEVMGNNLSVILSEEHFHNYSQILSVSESYENDHYEYFRKKLLSDENKIDKSSYEELAIFLKTLSLKMKEKGKDDIEVEIAETYYDYLDQKVVKKTFDRINLSSLRCSPVETISQYLISKFSGEEVERKEHHLFV